VLRSGQPRCIRSLGWGAPLLSARADQRPLGAPDWSWELRQRRPGHSVGSPAHALGATLLARGRHRVGIPNGTVAFASCACAVAAASASTNHQTRVDPSRWSNLAAHRGLGFCAADQQPEVGDGAGAPCGRSGRGHGKGGQCAGKSCVGPAQWPADPLPGYGLDG